MTGNLLYGVRVMGGPMQEISFRLRHRCLFGKLSDEFPEVVFSNWCNFSMEILEYKVKDPAVSARIQERITTLSKRGFKPISRSAKDGTSQMVLLRCGHKRGTSVDETMEDHGCLVLYPVVYRAGWEEYRIIAMDEEKLGPLFADLKKQGELDITSKRKNEEGLLSHSFVLSSTELFSGLTAKQADALKVAIEHGYYRVPRKIRFEDIAKSRKTPRTTFEEHVRKAESKIMTSLKPYVALYSEGPASAR